MIEFYKNDEKIAINQETISFNQLTLNVTKEEDDYLIILDFIKKECFMYLKDDSQKFIIEVIDMSYSNVDNIWTFEYELTSEEDTKNKIIITL